MNRSRRPVSQNKGFVAGGVYDPRTQQQSGFSGNQLGTPNLTQVPVTQGTPSTPRAQNTNGQNVAQRNGKQQQQTAPLQPPPQPPLMDDEPQITQQKLTDVKMEDANLYDESGKLQYKNIFRTRKKSSVRTKEKRLRVNRQLRKTLIPKNALMALHEVNGLTIGEYTVTDSPSGGFTATVNVNGKQYEGKGNSKMSAKNNASEKALRDYVLEKMREKPRRKNTATTGEAMDTSEDNNAAAGDENGEQDDGVIDDVPMANLASFAIYKLFVEWEKLGYPVPELRTEIIVSSGSAGNGEAPREVKTPKLPPSRTELPANWETIHPSTLLCMMRPGLQYRELGTVGERPNALQRMSVNVDGTEYASSGRSKKVARRNVAVTVLNSLFGTNFTQDGPLAE